jgi:hypothetical protein
MALTRIAVADGAGPVTSAVNQPRYSTDTLRRHVLRQEVQAPAWVERDGAIAVLLYKDELASLTPNEQASFSPTMAPNTAFAVHASDEPVTAWDRTISLVHFRFDEADGVGMPQGALTTNAPGWVRLASKARTTLVVPSMAVLQSAEGPYVLVMGGDRRTVSKRFIEVGKVSSLLTAVVAGAQLREQVVSTNAFFVDAERWLRAERGASQEIAP